MYLVKTDSEGNMQWQRTFGGAGDDWCYDVSQTSDGGYILAGQDGLIGSHCQAWLLKTDSNGNQNWSQLYGGEEVDKFHSVQLVDDGGYAAAGYTESFGLSTQMYLVKVDSVGQMQWQNNYGEQFGDACYKLFPTADSGYLLTGNWFSIYKVDSSGNQLWWTDPTWVVGAFAYSMCICSDGSFALAGEGDFGDNTLVIHMSGLQQAWVSLQPVNPPITIPASGGSFQFNVSLTNCGTVFCRPDAWVMVRLPNGQSYGPVLGPLAVPLDTAAVLTRLRVQNVPGNVPAGEYTYKAYVGTYNTAKWDSSSFTFTKLGFGIQDSEFSDWSCQGESFPGERSTTASIPSGLDLAVSPNPFNPSTVISYQLSALSHVSLKVYDTAGRLVATLVNGPQQAGYYRVSFDGSELPSGIYFCRLQADQFSATRKLILLK
jgi:hypothetical protein